MHIIKNPTKKQWDTIIHRPSIDYTQLFKLVQSILTDIKHRGDEAVQEYTFQFDKVNLNHTEVSTEEKNRIDSLIPKSLRQAILNAKKNIEKFHFSQKTISFKIETSTGVFCWQKSSPIEKVGLYIPGGTAPLFSTVLMLGIPAKIAGCKDIILCTPPNLDGKIDPAIIFAAQVVGIDRIFKIGGIQAIGSMAYGTTSVPRAYKLFGPGNQYVTAAKQLVSLQGVAIDIPAGPSEVAVIADETANPEFVASDLLAQAEHGIDSQIILFTISEKLTQQVLVEINQQLKLFPRKNIIQKVLLNGKIIILKNQQEIIELTNQYAPEHLIIETDNYKDLAEKITQAGSIFLGHYSPESAGDYASGTNHTLPTGGYAKSYGGVNLDSFIKKITFQEITKQGLIHLAPTIETMAENEQLHAHKHSVTIRTQ